MINFNLQGMYESYPLNSKVIELLHSHKEVFNDNINIHSCYGNFQFCTWDGGRSFTSHRHTFKEEMEEIVKFYNSYNIAVRYVFTNSLIPEENFHSRFENLMLSIGHNGLNEIVINNDKLEEYIRANYPNYHFISSTTKRLDNIESAKEELDKSYDYICLDYDLNSNKEFLESLSKEQLSHIELLCNAICEPNCSLRKIHYLENSKYSLNYGKFYQLDCPVCHSINSNYTITNKNTITWKNIVQYYYPFGIDQFKIEGRTLNLIDNICSYSRYLIKPEHQFEFIENIFSEINK